MTMMTNQNKVDVAPEDKAAADMVAVAVAVVVQARQTVDQTKVNTNPIDVLINPKPIVQIPMGIIRTMLVVVTILGAILLLSLNRVDQTMVANNAIAVLETNPVEIPVEIGQVGLVAVPIAEVILAVVILAAGVLVVVIRAAAIGDLVKVFNSKHHENVTRSKALNVWGNKTISV